MKNNIAVIGCGYWGKNLVRAFGSLGALHTVCDTRENVLKDVASKYKSAKISRNYSEVLADNEISAVVISTPASTHYDMAKNALTAGKDVFVEKPLALDASEGKELVSLSAEKGRILMVGHILHYHSAACELKRQIALGKLGRIRYIYSNRLNFGKIRREENILWSFAPHDISMIIGVLGAMPKEVSARGSNYLHPGIADVTTSHMRFENGVDAHIFVSWLHPFKEQKLVVIGERGMAVFNDTAPWNEKLIIYPHEVLWQNGIPEAKKASGERISVEEAEPLEAECRHFLECIKTRQNPLTDGNEGLKVLKILNAFQKSLDGNGIVVSLSQKERDYFVHETAIVENGAKIGKGVKIWHFSHVMNGAEIADGCSLGQNVVMMPGTKLGKNVKVQNNVSIYEKVTVEDDAFLGPSMVFTNVVNPRSHISRKHEYQETLVRKGASIGANATIVCGNEIGEYAFIGSGAVVTQNIPAYALVYGNPARQRGWMCQCGVKLTFAVDEQSEETVCASCGTFYERAGLKVTRKK